MSWVWAILGAVVVFAVLVLVLSVLERGGGAERDEQEPQRGEGDEP